MHQEKPRRYERDDDDESTEPAPTGRDRRADLDDSTEELLTEIDDVLEENATEFVRSYIQKGGE
ncbi:ubiquitin-like protein Pup [Saccharopolyspora rosea]|uniref:Prokaryotic ubiquitin-like protein Pup n=1 Tax=Saccharopolyspora rosea TaxID=524884 RepID=A0ABW3FPS8_9PSEU|nr:ubiquitin-like protein Pup [Saccharopolyspora rosea]